MRPPYLSVTCWSNINISHLNYEMRKATAELNINDSIPFLFYKYSCIFVLYCTVK